MGLLDTYTPVPDSTVLGADSVRFILRMKCWPGRAYDSVELQAALAARLPANIIVQSVTEDWADYVAVWNPAGFEFSVLVSAAGVTAGVVRAALLQAVAADNTGVLDCGDFVVSGGALLQPPGPFTPGVTTTISLVAVAIIGLVVVVLIANARDLSKGAM